MIRMVPRGVSTTADAYLTPVLGEYLDGFYAGFQGGRKGGLKVEFMGSDGGLVNLDVSDMLAPLTAEFHRSQLDSERSRRRCSRLRTNELGRGGTSPNHRVSRVSNLTDSRFDVGGTSTDVSRFDGRYEIIYETTTAGISIQSPQLDINTVAAGGGSCLTFRNGMFHAGPESAGAHPGPACYR